MSDASTSSNMVFSSTAFHHANATPSVKFFPSGCCSPTVSCHRPLNVYPKFLHFSHRENGSFKVLSLHTPVGYSRPPSAVNDPSVTKQNEFMKTIRLRFLTKLCKQRVVPFERKPLLASYFIDFL